MSIAQNIDALALNIKVENMTSSRGNTVPNQFIIHAATGRYFQSYGTMIAHEGPTGQVTLDEKSWNYSRTTSKYRNDFLNETIADTRRKIESGEYKLANLNA